MTAPPAIQPGDLPGLIEAGDNVHLAGSFGEARILASALVAGRSGFRSLPVWTTQLHADSALSRWEPDRHLDLRVLLSSPSLGKKVADGQIRYVPCRYPDIGRYLDAGKLRCDVALVPVSPPDARGLCSLGVTVGYLRALLRRASRVVAEVNGNMPRTCGDTEVELARFDALVASDLPLHETPALAPREAESAIASHVASLVPDGATLEIGYGTLPNAVLSALQNHRDLGVHTGTLTDGMIDLVEGGVITGARKEVDQGLLVATTAIGTRRLYDWIDDNPRVALREATVVVDPAIFARLPSFRAINTTLEVDLMGQANSELLPSRLLGGYGSLAELARGARTAPGGLSILALPSTNAKGTRSRIVPRLTSPLGATLGKLDVDVIVTEHGIADLRLLSPEARARAMIAIAHPRFREDLNTAQERTTRERV